MPLSNKTSVQKVDLQDALELAVLMLSAYEPSKNGSISEEYRALCMIAKGSSDAKVLRLVHNCLLTGSPVNEKRLERFVVTVKDGDVVVRDRALKALEDKGLSFIRVIQPER